MLFNDGQSLYNKPKLTLTIFKLGTPTVCNSELSKTNSVTTLHGEAVSYSSYGICINRCSGTRLRDELAAVLYAYEQWAELF